VALAVLDGLIGVLSRVNAAIGARARGFAALLLATMTAIVLLQVMCRYGLGSALGWSEELAKLLMVWTAFLVAPWVYRHGAHVSIDMLVAEQPRHVRLALRLALHALVFWILTVLLGEAWPLFVGGFGIRAATMPVAMAWFYAILPLGLSALLLVGAELMLRDLASLLNPNVDYEIAPDRRWLESE